MEGQRPGCPVPGAALVHHSTVLGAALVHHCPVPAPRVAVGPRGPAGCGVPSDGQG